MKNSSDWKLDIENKLKKRKSLHAARVRETKSVLSVSTAVLLCFGFALTIQHFVRTPGFPDKSQTETTPFSGTVPAFTYGTTAIFDTTIVSLLPEYSREMATMKDTDFMTGDQYPEDTTAAIIGTTVPRSEPVTIPIITDTNAEFPEKTTCVSSAVPPLPSTTVQVLPIPEGTTNLPECTTGISIKKVPGTTVGTTIVVSSAAQRPSSLPEP